MRVIERRFIVKVQDRTPNALTGITNLIKLTYSNLSNDVKEFNEAKSYLKSKQYELSAAIILIQTIIKYLDLSAKTTVQFLESLVTPVEDWDEHSWEEMTWPVLETLYHTGPLKKNKNSTIDDCPTINMTDFDLNRFKKLLTSFCDRITRLSSSSPSSGGNDTNLSTFNISDDSNNNDQIINENDEDEMKNETNDWLNNDISGIDDVFDIFKK